MKSFNENDLIAYHLQELPPRRARALEKILQVDPVLAAESAAYAAVLRPFKAAIPLEVNEELVQRNWIGLRSKLPRYPLRGVRSARWLLPALCGAGLAFAATFLVVTQRHTVPPVSSIASMKGPGSAEPAAAAIENPPDSSAGTNPPDSRRQYGLRQRIFSATPWPDHLAVLRHNEPPRVIASIPRESDKSDSVVHDIPLAHTPIASLPPLNTPLLPVQQGMPPQGSVTRTAFKRQHDSIQLDHSMDVTLAVGGLLVGTKDLSSNGSRYSQGISSAGRVVASFHQQLQPFVGYRVAFSYTHPNFLYGTGGNQIEIKGRIYEVAGTYVIQGPHRGIVNTTLEAGAGMMAMVSSAETADPRASRNLRGVGTAGIGADFTVSKHFAVHTGYRMQVFKGTDFQSGVSGVPIAGTALISSQPVSTALISNEPIVGITYRFSDK